MFTSNGRFLELNSGSVGRDLQKIKHHVQGVKR